MKLDKEERELVAKGENMPKEQIWEALEKRRFEELQKAAVRMQGQLLVQQRCPKCTLVPPCRHYEHPFEVTNDAENFILSKRFKNYVPPAKRENLLSQIKQSQLALNSQSSAFMSFDATHSNVAFRPSRYEPNTPNLPSIINVASDMIDQPPATERTPNNFSQRKLSVQP